MAHTTLASTDRALEKIDDFVGEYLSGFVGVQMRVPYAATVVADEPFPVGVTVELHGLHPAIILNGRHVVVVPTPLDVAARGRINVVLDGAVYAIHRENLRAVATP